MSILLNDNLDVAIAKPVDTRFGPYDTVGDALSSIRDFQRFQGLVVGILFYGVVKEYWFKNGVTDTDFEEKTSVGGISSDQLNAYIPTSQASSFATTEQISAFITSSALAAYIPTSQLSSLATTSELSGYIPTEQISAYIGTSERSSFATTDQISAFITTASLSGYTSTEQLSLYIPTSQISGFATTDQISAFITSSALAAYIPSSQASSFATTEQISGFVSSDQLNAYIPTSQASSFAATDQLNAYIPTSQISGFATTEQISGFISSDQLNAYIPTSQLSSLATTGQLSGYISTTQTSSFASTSQLEAYISTTQLGAANGVAQLDGSSTIKTAQLPALSGDVTGDYTSNTVTKLRGISISEAAPNDGQLMQYIASTNSWVPGSVPAGGNGGGGLVFYFNPNTSPDNPITGLPYTSPGATSVSVKELGRTNDLVTTSTTSAHLPSTHGTYDIVAAFVSDVLDPDVTQIPAGLWDFNIWMSSDATVTNQVVLQIRLYKYNGTAATLIASSDDISVYDPSVTAQYIASIVVPTTSIELTDRIYIEFLARGTSNNKTITLKYGTITPSHVHTTIPSIGGTGLVKVINGVFQSPASPLVDADVSTNAAIAISKISGLQTSLDSKALKSLTIYGGTGLAGGGDLSANRTLSLAALVTAAIGTIGGSASIPQITIDVYGRVTSAQAYSITASSLGAVATSDIIAISKGGTGSSTAAAALTALGAVSTGDVIGLAKGGTGATSAALALTALGAAGLASNTFTGTQTLKAGTTNGTASLVWQAGSVLSSPQAHGMEWDGTNLFQTTSTSTRRTISYDPTVSTQSGTTYTLALADAGNTILFSSASAVTVTVPLNSSVNYRVGTQILLIQTGAGQITVSPASGATLQSSGSKTKSASRYSVLTLIQIAANTWILGGDITT